MKVRTVVEFLGSRRSWCKPLKPMVLVCLLAAAPALSDMSGFGVPSGAARLPFGLPQTADPLGGLGRTPSALDAPIQGDFDRPLNRLQPGAQAGPLEPVRPVAPVQTPPPRSRPTPAEPRFSPLRDRNIVR